RARARAEARRALGLPQGGPVALVSGGGWGVGDVEGAVEAALRVPELTVVCLSGKNEVLHARLEHVFGSEPRVRIVPFTDRMSELLAAADVLVDSSVGVTCLEALASGCRIVVYGTPPGHSRDNERAIVGLGLAQAARTPRELAALLAEARDEVPALPAAEPASALIL